MVRSFIEAAVVIRSTIADKYPQVSRAFGFGSSADGIPSADSDLDLLVEMSAPMGLAFLSLIQDMERATGLVVDVIMARQARELERKFGYDIVKKARLVCEKTEN